VRDFQWWGGEHLPILFKMINIAALQAQFAQFVMPVRIIDPPD
jgi:hypothetical protein